MWQSRESSAPGDEVFACSAVGGEGHVLRELAEDSLHHGHVLQILVRLEQRVACATASPGGLNPRAALPCDATPP